MGGEAAGRGAQPLRALLRTVAALVFALPVFAYSLFFTIYALRILGTDPEGYDWGFHPGVILVLPWAVSGASALLLRRHHGFAMTVALAAASLLVVGIIGIALLSSTYQDPDADQSGARALRSTWLTAPL